MLERGLFIRQCADTVYSTPLEMTAKHTPTVVEPGATIEVAFNDGPSPERIKSERWLEDGTNKTVQLKNERVDRTEQTRSLHLPYLRVVEARRRKRRVHCRSKMILTVIFENDSQLKVLRFMKVPSSISDERSFFHRI